MSVTESVHLDEPEPETKPAHPGIPLDSFRVRIAAIRAEKGWNVSQAAMACGLSVENWRKWEKTGRQPQAYEEACRKIANGSGYDRVWIAAGGPMRTTWSGTVVGHPADEQGVLSLDFGLFTTPALVLERWADGIIDLVEQHQVTSGAA